MRRSVGGSTLRKKSSKAPMRLSTLVVAPPQRGRNGSISLRRKSSRLRNAAGSRAGSAASSPSSQPRSLRNTPKTSFRGLNLKPKNSAAEMLGRKSSSQTLLMRKHSSFLQRQSEKRLERSDSSGRLLMGINGDLPGMPAGGGGGPADEVVNMNPHRELGVESFELPSFISFFFIYLYF